MVVFASVRIVQWMSQDEIPFVTSLKLIADCSVGNHCTEGWDGRSICEGVSPLYGGGVAEWFRALDLESGGPWFKFTVIYNSAKYI